MEIPTMFSTPGYLPDRFGGGLRRRVLQRRFPMQPFGVGEQTISPRKNRVFIKNDHKYHSMDREINH